MMGRGWGVHWFLYSFTNANNAHCAACHMCWLVKHSPQYVYTLAIVNICRILNFPQPKRKRQCQASHIYMSYKSNSVYQMFALK